MVIYRINFCTYRVVLNKIPVSRPRYQCIDRYLKQCSFKDSTRYNPCLLYFYPTSRSLIRSDMPLDLDCDLSAYLPTIKLTLTHENTDFSVGDDDVFETIGGNLLIDLDWRI